MNRGTGFSPYMLVMGREPRTALHCILGDVERSVGPLNSSVAAIVADMRDRQRVASAMLDRRSELKRERIMRNNAKLAAAFNLRWDVKVWVYSQPITHAAYTQAEQAELWKTMLSKKFLDHWTGPFDVLAVGPIYHGDELVQSNVVMINAPAGPTRVTAGRIKLCRDPGAGDKPTGLPDGFARYLLSRNPLGGLLPQCITDDDVTWTSDRHGVEAVVAHRVLRDARGRPSDLQYLVRWEGDHVADSSENANMLDGCESATVEYWHTASAAGATVAHAGTPVVQGRMRQAHERANDGGPTVRTGSGRYKLPNDTIPLRLCPTQAYMASEDHDPHQGAHPGPQGPYAPVREHRRRGSSSAGPASSSQRSSP